MEDEDDERTDLIGMWLEGDSLAPPCQADLDIVFSILEFCDLDDSSFIIDLGCGDGRICIQASLKYGCRSAGCEIEPHLIQKFQKLVQKHNLEEKVTIIHNDLREIDFVEATVIVVYLLPDAIEEIKPKLLEAIDRGATVVCNTWGPKGIEPIETRLCGFSNNVKLLKYRKL